MFEIEEKYTCTVSKILKQALKICQSCKLIRAIRVCKLNIFYILIRCAIILQAVDRIGAFEQRAEDANVFQPSKSKKVTIKEPLR